MKKWYVVHTRPREEALAAEHLSRQGFTTYYPRYRKRSCHARKVREVAVSLFPRYLFVAFDATVCGWRVIRSTRGVVDLVRHGPDPTPVPRYLIDEIRVREDADGCVVLGRQAELRKGQRIRLLGEAFGGCELIFEAIKDSDRIVALMSLLGREFEIEVPIGSVAV